MKLDLALALTSGLLGGFGHCLGMCGPLVSSLQLVARAEHSALGRGQRLARSGLYHLGRITTYAAVGALMGLTGSFVNTAGDLAGVQQLVAVLAGGVMVVMGLGMLGALRKLGALEGVLMQRLRGLLGPALRLPGAARYLALGLLLGLLPCGLSYTIFAGAAATGSPLQGALLATAFGLGTAPALLLLTLFVDVLGVRLRGLLSKLGATTVIALGLIFAWRGLQLALG